MVLAFKNSLGLFPIVGNFLVIERFGALQEFELYAIQNNGKDFPGFPKPLRNPLPQHGAAAGDINGDGNIDLFYGGGGIYNHYLWTFSGVANTTNLVWPQFQHDAQKTGEY